jgi:queuine tRNA-ribosyltransferase
LLGVGKPQDIVAAVARGCDTFDCVIPTREARHGRLYINKGEPIDIRLEKYREDFTALDSNCDCYMCQHYSKAYLRHLFTSDESLAIRLFSVHNLKFYLGLMEKIRQAIIAGTFYEFAKQYGP